MSKNFNNSKIPILFEVLKERKITQTQLAKAIDVSTGNVTDWKNGKSIPNSEKLTEIADYLGCSVHYLLGKTKRNKVNLYAERYLPLVEKSGKHDIELEKDMGLPRSILYDWRTGKNKSSYLKYAANFSEYFGVSTDYLLGKTDDPTPIKSNITAVIGGENIYQIPVFESVSAGFGAYASNDIIDFMPIVIKNPHDASDTIAIKVSGDSMYPKIEDGDITVVRRQTSVDKGDIAVVLLDGEEGLVKRVMYDTDWIELQSINPEYKPKRFEGAEVQRLQIVGKVIQIIKIL